MSDLSNRAAEEASRRQSLPEWERCSECERGEQSALTGPSIDAGMLFSNRATGVRANSIPRATALQTMQRTHGNRAVQRCIQRQVSSEAVPVQRYIAGAPGLLDTIESYWQQMTESEPAKPGERPHGHAQGGQNRMGGYEGDFSVLGGRGDILGLPIGIDWITGGGKFGAWEEGDAKRYGIQGSAGVEKMKFNEGGDVSGDAGVGTVTIDSNAGENGASLGVGANIVEGSVTLGDFGDKTDGGEQANNESAMRVGLSAGLGGAGRLHWGDSDGDGHREYGGGFDFGPVSMDYKTEDPLRTGLGMVLGAGFGPAGMYAADKGLEWLMGDTNMTDKAGEYGGKAYDYAGEKLNDAGEAITEFGSDIYDTGSEMYNAAEETVTETYNDVKEEAGKFYDDPEAYAEEKYEAASDYVEEQYEAVKEYIPDVELPDIEYDPRNWF